MSSMTGSPRSVPLLGALILAACGGGTGGTASTPGISGDTIYVGALTPLSDPVAVIGKPLLRGIQVYFDQVNADF